MTHRKQTVKHVSQTVVVVPLGVPKQFREKYKCFQYFRWELLCVGAILKQFRISMYKRQEDNHCIIML